MYRHLILALFCSCLPSLATADIIRITGDTSASFFDGELVGQLTDGEPATLTITIDDSNPETLFDGNGLDVGLIYRNAATVEAVTASGAIFSIADANLTLVSAPFFGDGLFLINMPEGTGATVAFQNVNVSPSDQIFGVFSTIASSSNPLIADEGVIAAAEVFEEGGYVNPVFTFSFANQDDEITTQASFRLDQTTASVEIIPEPASLALLGLGGLVLLGRRRQGRGAALALMLAGGLCLAPASHAAVVGGPIVNPANGHTYYLLEEASWTDSQAQAVSLEGNLVTINDAAENQWIVDTFADVPANLWIGYNDAASEGDFTWVSGEPVTYTNFFGSITSSNPDVDYAYMSLAPVELGQWYPTVNTLRPSQGIVEVVPEPSSIALIALAGPLLMRRRRAF